MIGIAVIAVVALLILAVSTVRMWSAEHHQEQFDRHIERALRIGNAK